MDIQATKLELMQYLLEEKNVSVLNRIKDIFTKENADIVAYTTSGEPVNLNQYKAKIKRGLDDVKAGRITSSKDLREEIKTW